MFNCFPHLHVILSLCPYTAHVRKDYHMQGQESFKEKLDLFSRAGSPISWHVGAYQCSDVPQHATSENISAFLIMPNHQKPVFFIYIALTDLSDDSLIYLTSIYTFT